jgi:sarcosine oxidase subunit alpha
MPAGEVFGITPYGTEALSVTADNDQGVITSVAFSPSLNHWIALGLLGGGLDRVGESVMMVDFMREALIEVDVCSPVFVDPKGERLRA